MSSVFSSSCQKTEVISDLPGRLSSYYLIKSYLETDNISIKKSVDYILNDDSYAVHFDGQKTIEENSAEFKPLALQNMEKKEWKSSIFGLLIFYI